MTNARPNTYASPINLFEQSEIGLFELSDAGTILYCRTNADGQLSGTSVEAVGRNFFDDAAPFENTEELRLRLKDFVNSNSATEKFNFVCRIADRVIPAKIMLVRVAEQSEGRHDKTVIVDIRKI